MTKRLLVLLLSLAGWRQLPPTLDLTVPPSTPGSERIRSVRNHGSLQLSTSVIDVPDSQYIVGDAFDYTVELTNTSSSNITIPWSGAMLDINDVPDDQLLVGTIALTISNGNGPERGLAAAMVFGRRNIPSSLLVLAPGTSARVRASSDWSVVGVKIRDYLASSSGRVTIRAKYLMEDDGTVYSSVPSQPYGLTLRLRDPI